MNIHLRKFSNSDQLMFLEFLMRLFTITLAGIAVPVFYVISGYLLFNKSGDNYSLDIYYHQVKKRIGSLVIPYLLWNLIVYLLLYVLAPFVKVTMGTAEPSLMQDSYHKFWAIFNITGVPPDGPLYFIRNLFILVLFSPAIYFLLKQFKIVFVFSIAVLWLFVDIPTDNPLYSYLKALPFFTVGAFVGIKKPPLKWLYKNSKLIISSFVFCIIIDSLFALGIIDNGIIQTFNNVGYYNEINQFSFRLSNYIGVLAAFCLAEIISFRKRRYESLNSSVFFIYSFHVVVIAICMLVGGFFVFPIDSVTTYLLVYLFITATCIIVSIILYYLCNRFIPRISLILSGNRK